MAGMHPYAALRSYRTDPEVANHKLARGTWRRIMEFARPYRRLISAFLVLVVGGSSLVVVTPLLLQRLVDDGVIPGNRTLVVQLALLVAALAFVERASRWRSGGSRPASARG